MAYTMRQMRELDRAQMEAEARGEEFDEDAFFRRQLHEIRMQEALENDEYEEEGDPEPEDDGEEESFDEGDIEDSEDWDVDGFADDIEQSLSEEDDLSDETEEDFYEEEDIDEGEDSESDETYDPWTEDDHRQQQIRRGSEYSSNRGLYEAGKSAADFYEQTHFSSEDGHGISVAPLTAFEKDDSEKVFRRPETDEEKRRGRTERLRRIYKTNEELREEREGRARPGVFDEDESSFLDDAIESWISRSWHETEDSELEPEPSVMDYQDDIERHVEARVNDYYENDAEGEHLRRLRTDSRYLGSADYERHIRESELVGKFELYQDNPGDEDLYLPKVEGTMNAIREMDYLYERNGRLKDRLNDMLENGVISGMQHTDQSIALTARLRRQLTDNEYKVISGGDSMFEDIGISMDEYNNMLDDVYTDNPNTWQNTRRIIGSVPNEVADMILGEMVEDSLISRDQKNHFMTMYARPTKSLSRS